MGSEIYEIILYVAGYLIKGIYLCSPHLLTPGEGHLVALGGGDRLAHGQLIYLQKGCV
jgi:hypothetical protein